MIKLKGLIVMLGLAAFATLAVACNNGEASTVEDKDSPPVVSSTGNESPQVSGAPRQAFSSLLQADGLQGGIRVTGEGTITLEPDLALLNIGIETVGDTVTEARDDAARAMDAVVAALRARGIDDRDIQTRFFNISPRYEFQEVVEDRVRRGKQVLVGYQVNNSAAIKIRDLDAVGSIIDDVATAGGDATRINGINFTVEDPKPLMTGLREQAVEDALAKAQQFADLTGVVLGQLLFITESRGGAPVVSQFAEGAVLALAAPAPPTQISGGELELRMTIQALVRYPVS